MAHREKHTKYGTPGGTDPLGKRALAIPRVTDNKASARDVGIDTPRGRGNSSTRQWLAHSVRCWASALGFSFGTILAAHAASTDAVTAISPGNPLQITSLTAYASQLKHKWTKYAEGNKGTLRQASYVDLANIIRAGDTATVLNLQDWNPYLQVGTTEDRYGSHCKLDTI